VPEIHWDTIIIYLTNRRLPQDLREKWCRSATNLDLKQGKWPTFKQFIIFLETECCALESAKIDQCSVGQSKPQMRSNSHVATSSNYSYNCIVCQDISHKIFYRPLFLKMTVMANAEIVKRNRLCFNSLKQECNELKCTSRVCLKCNNKYNTLLHFENYKSNKNKHNNKVEENDSSSQEQENKIPKTTNNSNEVINESNVNCTSIIQ